MECVERMPLIDLSILPRIQSKRNFGKIDWDHVIGMELQFKHENIEGKIIFVDRYKNKMLIKRIIYGYEYIKEIWITFGALRKGFFHVRYLVK